MKVLYFDCFSGISGDMTVAALLDLGLDVEKFKNELKKLKISGYELAVTKKVKSGITGTDFDVILDHDVRHDHSHADHGDHGHEHSTDCCHLKEEWHNHAGHEHNHYHKHDDSRHHNHSDDHYHTRDHDNRHSHSHSYSYDNNHHHNHGHDHNHSHNHNHSHDNDHDHDHSHSNSHSHSHNHDHSARNLRDIKELILASDLKQSVKDFSIRVFEEIARAEAKVHNKGIEEVHFHEVGAVDSIVDIVGTAICLDMLGVDKVYSSPVHEGTGFIECQHGKLPVPVPAVMEMLKGSGIPLVTEDVNTELVTPTGIGILKCLASSFGKMPVMTVEKAGYGMGKRETGGFNALRVVLGTLQEDRTLKEGVSKTEGIREMEEVREAQEIVVLETNIDDMNPEILGYTVEILLENGALDAFYTPIYMKKNRPAVMLTVLSDMKSEEKLVDIMLRETSTFGIRRNVSSRYCMSRHTINVSTEYGDVRVKVGQKDSIKKFAPEYEDCREIAKKTGLPIRKIYEAACKKAVELV